MDAQEKIRSAYEDLAREIEAIDAIAAPLISEGKKINAKVLAAQAELRPITEELKKYRGPDYAAKKKLLGQLAVALGGKKIVAEPGRA